ncbi:MAG: type I polyketide synthase [Jatrophihabitantaceae bacterium]
MDTSAEGVNQSPARGRTPAAAEPIAIVGMSCRLPQAADLDAFWHVLHDGVDAVTEATEDRWPLGIADGYRRAGFIDGVDGFDADFFGISPNEAAAMDPQQRLALELSWEALEHARLIPADLRDSDCGVFLGTMAQDYATLLDRLGSTELGPHSYPGTSRAIIANRISYLLGLRGRSMSVDAGQSSSLIAVQLACESLRRGESRLALAGGVNLNLLAETTAAIGSFGALSPEGRCSVFDERADGYVRGEGAAFVVLKPLSAALADGDSICCLILGGAVNNDGGGNSLTAPSQRAQQDVIERACAQAGVNPEAIQYVELHGTGTPIGDPIEAAALGAALGAARPADQPLLVGSVKTNIGHLEGAAGVAGLVKLALSLRHRQVPASLHFRTAPAKIPLAELGLEVVQSTRGWPSPDQPLIAGVSSFGMGGTNCHLVLGEAPAVASRQPPASRPDLPWLLSARSGPALRAQAQRLRGRIASQPAEVGQVALALATSRTAFEDRAVILGEDFEAMLAGLDALAAGTPNPALVTGTVMPGRCAFVFPGQGSQWQGMARALLAGSADFAERMAACDQALAPFVDYSLIDVLRAEPGADELARVDLSRVDVVQPALWAVMVCLAELWRVNGVRPDVVIGHSQGEIAAATVVGALSLSDGARVVALRSRALAAVAGTGGMMSVAAGRDEIEQLLRSQSWEVTIAAENSPRSVVLSGAAQALSDVRSQLGAAGYRTKIVPVDYASHSAAMEQLRQQLSEALAPVRPVSVGVTFLSTLTGQPMDTAGLDAEYWYRSLCQPVQFGQATRLALAEGCRVFLECSPHPVLVAAVEETIEDAEQQALVLSTLRREHGSPAQFRRALAEAYVGGLGVDWAGSAQQSRAELIELPTYAFQPRRHWLAGVSDAARRPIELSSIESAESAPAVARTRGALRDLVLALTAEVLGHDSPAAISTTRTFKELGVGSDTAVTLRNRLRAATGLALPTGLLYDYPTPDQLVDRLKSLTRPSDFAVAEAARPRALEDPLENDPIVIVAMGCRFPGGVASPAALWDLLRTGSEAITEFPDNRGWDVEALFATGAERSGTSDTRLGGFLHDADQFDAAFFGISPREALAMDPQQRVLLEVCWETLERAGLDPWALRGSQLGVFVGAMAPDYGPRLHLPDGSADGHLLTGTALSVLSGRIAYTFGLEGPAVTIDTACSSSLVAIHLASQALRRGECSAALAGGVTVMSNPGMFVEFSRQGGLSVDGRCKPFSAEADGTGWAEGAGVVMLERLSAARRNGRQVLAVLRGTAVNQDGRSNGMTAPNGVAQQRVIRQALDDAGLQPGDIDAVEAHGTGTSLGDPIEAQALLATYGEHRDPDQPLWLGSIKSNIGHTQAAAGVAGVIKMVLALGSATLPASLHAAKPSHQVDWSGDAVRLLAQPMPWPHRNRPAQAGVSGFGISGTNGHLILEQAPAADPEPCPVSELPLVWVLAARTEQALSAYARRLRDYAEAASEQDLQAAGRGLARRARLTHRAVVVASDRAELLAALTALIEGGPHSALLTGQAEDVQPVFLFPGQGSQWVGMAVELLDAHINSADFADFADRLEECDAALRPHTGWSVLDVLRAAPGAPDLAGSDVIQPVLFAVMVSLAQLWRSWGVEPVSVVGHSQGEIAAACVAGVLSLPDAAKMVALRSKALMSLTGTGGMLAVALPAEQVRERIAGWPDRLWVAIGNGPQSTVVAGDLDALEEFQAACGNAVQVRRIATDYASHTPHIDRLRTELLELLDGVQPRHSEVAFCSALAGDFVRPAELVADYWYRVLREPVRFHDAVQAFGGYSRPLFIEVSPHPVLIGHVQDTLRDSDLAGDAIGSLRRGEGGPRRILIAAAEGYVRGAAVDWAAVLGSGPAPRAELPSYPFEHRRYWLEGSTTTATGGAGGAVASDHPLLSTVTPLADGDGYLLTGRLSRGSALWLGDHAVNGTVLLPGTAFLELALEAATVAGCDLVEDLTLHAPLYLPEVGGVQLQLRVSGPDGQGSQDLSVHSRPAHDPEAGWTRHATGRLGAVAGAPAAQPAAGDLAEWPPVSAVAVDLHDVYGRLADLGYDYGPAFQGLARAWRTETDSYLEVALPEAVRQDAGRFRLHPALLDAALHLLVLDGMSGPAQQGSGPLLPFSWTGVRVLATGADELRVRITDTGADQLSLSLFTGAGDQLASVQGLSLRRAALRAGVTGQRSDSAPHSVSWIDPGVAGLELGEPAWAVIGDDGSTAELAAELTSAGVKFGCYYDLPSLAEMTAGNAPSTVLVPFTPEPDTDDLPYTVREGMYEVLELVQSWAGDDRFADSRLVVLTRGAGSDGWAASEGSENEHGLLSSPVWGLLRAAQAEHPGRFALVDRDGEAADWSAIAAALAAGESQLSVRHGLLLAPRLVRQELPDADVALDANGTVLITGGTSGLGALAAQRLAATHGVRHLVLVSRRGPDAPEAARLVAELRALGAEVAVLACDVSDRQALRAVLDSIPAEHPLTGVVHSAGVLDDATVDGLSAHQFDTVFAPKLDGAWHLHELTRDLPLSTFLMFSSVAGVLGNAGQANYAAANAFLDSLAGYRRRLGLPAVSIDWGLWEIETTTTEAVTAADRARLARTGIAPLSTEAGLGLLDTALSWPEPVLVAARWDTAALRARAEDGPLPPLLRAMVATPRRVLASGGAGRAPSAGSARELVQQLAGKPPAAGRQLLIELVRSHVAAVLAYPDVNAVDADQGFSELGFDSLTVVELRNRLDLAIGLRLPATLAFDYPNATALAEHLLRTLAPAAPSPEENLRAALDAVQQALTGQDDATRGKIAAILHSTLARWELAPAETPGLQEEIRSASDEEIFAFIDNQL